MPTIRTRVSTHIRGIIVRVSIYKHSQAVEESIVGKHGPCGRDRGVSGLGLRTSHTYIHPMEVIAEGIQKHSQANKVILVSKHRA